LDLPGIGMDEFAAAFHERRYVTRTKARGFHESDGVSVYLGKSPLILRIYDKVAEMARGWNPVKSLLMVMRRWGGAEPEKASRVEFELRRDALKEHGIDTPADYFAKRGDLAAYLCGEWVRFTSSAVDRDNTARAAVLPLWLAVTAGFKAWTGEPTGLPLTPLDRGQVDVRQLEKQAVGVLLTAAVLCGKARDVVTFRNYSGQVIRSGLSRNNFDREKARR
jgi:hypothetical protein